MQFSKLLKSFIESKFINVFITFVILINAVTLGLEASEKLVSKIGNILTYIDKIALSIFVVELIIKLFGMESFSQPKLIYLKNSIKLMLVESIFQIHYLY